MFLTYILCCLVSFSFFFFFFNDTATTEIYTLSLHDALPIPFALLVYYALFRARQRWRNAWLIVAGYTFYGWAEPRFMVLMFGTTFIDWLMSLVIAHNTWQVWRVWDQPVK